MKDEKQRTHWFKRRRYGYGWTPVTWQGWLVLAVLVGVIIVSAIVLTKDAPDDVFSKQSLVLAGIIVVATVLTVAISLKKGPKPKWRWGKRPTDDPNEDI